ncbi:hypothetical protein BJ165DRAFT_1022312 [Panaeolus papilionaceus]|nr:hypothetical protein BJ165DRAFT_1022312 [Panaeolus papilionaceus]
MGNVRLPSNTFTLDELVSDITADIDTEIDARTRLAETLEARIAWAVILKESAAGKAAGNASQATFKNVACETLVENEENSRFLFTSGPTPPPIPQAGQQVSCIQKKVAPFPTKQKASFLYIRSTALNHSTNDVNHLYLLKCPACGRTTFTSLQGLLNHARLSHNLEWGTHDECIRACAVPDNDMDITQGAEVGLGPSGVLAGLRTIFERAVGTSKHNINFQVEPTDLQTEASQESATTQTQLNLTLGLHEESPALAPFLGKTVIRRQISVCDEDVDITTSTQPEANRKLRWKMPFAHRSFREDLTKSLDEPADHTIPSAETNCIEGNNTIAAQETLANQHSRFHFIARIIVADRSMWVAPEHKSPEASTHTHKWMISIDAPSYAVHITSILKCVQVTPQTEDITSVSIPPPTYQPPFIVLGTSNAPFLAKITLTFTGTNRDGPTKTEQKVTLEHWVDLDPLRSGLVTVGQEQILDVELDKNTQLSPIYTGYLPISSKAHWSLPPWDAPQPPKMKRADGHHQILVKLAKQYPLLVKAEKPPPGVKLAYSYLLPTSSLQWNEFCAGRRKAIAWGRSQAICEAYKNIRQSSGDNMQHLMELKTGDVYRWLLGNGMFPATPGQQISPDSSSIFRQEALNLSNLLSRTTDQWCTMCGLLVGGSEQPDSQHCCAVINTPRVSGFSRMDVRKSLWEQKSQLHPSHYDNPHPGQSPLPVHPSFLRRARGKSSRC